MYQKLILLALISLVSFAGLKAQYPQVSKEDQERSKKLIDDAERHSDSMWTIAYPIIKKEATKGRPYIPWASR